MCTCVCLYGGRTILTQEAQPLLGVWQGDEPSSSSVAGGLRFCNRLQTTKGFVDCTRVHADVARPRSPSHLQARPASKWGRRCSGGFVYTKTSRRVLLVVVGRQVVGDELPGAVRVDVTVNLAPSHETRGPYAVRRTHVMCWHHAHAQAVDLARLGAIMAG